jgi:hypothetical protein
MRKGELLVIGSDSIAINLRNTSHPDDVSVHFKDVCEVVPCDPGHEDDLQWWCSQGDDGYYYLNIAWNVSGTREVAWTVCW